MRTYTQQATNDRLAEQNAWDSLSHEEQVEATEHPYRFPETVIYPATTMIVADGRDESEPCDKLTPGCCVDHRNGYDICETW